MKTRPATVAAPRLLPSVAERRFSLLAALVVGSIGLGIICYREPFRFFVYPLSDLGATVTENGLPNTVSNIFFDSGMIVSGMIMLSIARRIGQETIPHRKLKLLLVILSAGGFLVITYPCNINNNIHMAGSAALVGGLWGLTVLLLFEVFPFIDRRWFWALHILLQGTILPYAALFAVGLPIKQAFQKPAVLALIGTLRIVIAMQDVETTAVRSRDVSDNTFANASGERTSQA